MGVSKNGKVMGRPRKVIDKEAFQKLCHIQCTQEEIAHFFEVNVDTICDWCKREYGQTYSEIYKIYSDGGKMSIRRIQFKLAERNTAMAIWLGKQYLGQRDNIDANITELTKVDELLEEIKKSATKQ